MVFLSAPLFVQRLLALQRQAIEAANAKTPTPATVKIFAAATADAMCTALQLEMFLHWMNTDETGELRAPARGLLGVDISFVADATDLIVALERRKAFQDEYISKLNLQGYELPEPIFVNTYALVILVGMGGSQRLTSSRCYDLLKELFMPRVALEENCEGLSKFCILDPEGPVSSQVEMSPHLQVIVGEDDEEPRNVAGNQNIVLKPSSFTVAMALPKMQQRLNATVVFLASVALATRLYYHEASQSEFGRRMEDLRQKFEDQWSIQIDDRHGLGSRYLVTVRHLLGFLPFLQSGLLRESLTLGSHMLVGRSQILKLTVGT
eukprot:GHVT01097064.1.p1 GENE.GHVT01097064.1~~GHVT01097064.1.p1  ORF type:complete len:322 (+),score=38.31 GHVT01097064.1:354-1319(+)